MVHIQESATFAKEQLVTDKSDKQQILGLVTRQHTHTPSWVGYDFSKNRSFFDQLVNTTSCLPSFWDQFSGKLSHQQ